MRPADQIQHLRSARPVGRAQQQMSGPARPHGARERVLRSGGTSNETQRSPVKECNPLNNNNRGTNRRRGRGSNRPQGGGGGGAQLNRIDSRARGNAPQLLEKYRKLAHDAHLNGDRVTAEYYLQFADHYFRVLADQRVRQDEQRKPRDERWQEGDTPERDDGDDAGEFSAESDFPSFDQPPAAYQRRDREERPERGERPERNGNWQRPQRQDERDEQPAPEPAAEPANDGAEESGEASIYEPVENPFVRGSRGLRPRRDDRRPRRDDADDGAPGIDPMTLPPAISVAPASAADEDAPAPKRPRGRPRKAAGDALTSAEQD